MEIEEFDSEKRAKGSNRKCIIINSEQALNAELGKDIRNWRLYNFFYIFYYWINNNWKKNEEKKMIDNTNQMCQ